MNMGALELRAYKRYWRASRHFRGHAAGGGRRRKEIFAHEDPLTSCGAIGGGFSALRHTWAAHDFDMDEEDEPVVMRNGPRASRERPVSPAEVAASLMCARLFDARPDLLGSMRSAAPVIAIDVSDPDMLEKVLGTWQETLLSQSVRVMNLGERHGGRDSHDLILVAAREVPKGGQPVDRQREALWALQVALPIVAISPSAETHVASALLKAAPTRVRFPLIDAATILRTIRVVTGRPCREVFDETVASRFSLEDLVVAVRFDRSSDECMNELRRLAALKDRPNTGRGIELDQIFGMEEAVQWARSSIRDLDAWRRGEIPWSAVDHAVCLVGPPGTGKTLFASAYAKAAGARMIACSLARWQAADDGHLGHLLRAMRKDFAEARAQTPCVLFVDEIDSFADRSKVRHSHADYAVQVVNAFLAELDGLAGRDGLLFCAASNDISRCDPAILRSGRFSKIIRIGLPDAEELERMFRVRLRGQLAAARLDDICLLGMGSTGADVERIVEDARRFARQETREIELADLRRALVGDRERNPAEIERAAIHEAGHLLMEILLFGEVDSLFAHIVSSGDRGGATVRTRTPTLQGTYEDYSKRLQVLLAGRVAEEMILHAYSDGGGGRRGSDLDQGTRLAAAMVASLGLAGTSLLFLGSREDTSELLSYPEVRRAARAELAGAADACRLTLLKYRGTLERFAAVLLRDGSLDGIKAEKILSDTSASWSVTP